MVRVRIPSTVKEARSILESKSGFVNNLIIPNIETQDSDGYSYVLPSSTMEIALLTGAPVENLFLSNVSNPSHHPRSIFRAKILTDKLRDIPNLRDEELIVPFGIWSDGFDAGRMSKANRSVVKLTTVHICHHTICKCHVYPIAFGRNKDDHERVRSTIWDDVCELSNSARMCYLKELEKTMAVRFVLTYLIQDRPEHSDWTGFGSHAGKFSTIPGISSPLKINGGTSATPPTTFQVQKQLASCVSCYERRINMIINMDSDCCNSRFDCTQCDDWDVLNVKFTPHVDYPRDSTFFSPVMVAKRITFDTMKEACESIFSKSFKGIWMRKNVDRFGQYECLRRDFVEDIWYYAKERRPVNPAERRNAIPPPFPSHLLPKGIIQRNLKLEDCMVGIMHTLVLNLGKHLLGSAMALMKLKKEWNTFRNLSDDLLAEVQGLSLSWCKAWCYSSDVHPASSWVSENYLAFSVLSKSLCSLLKFGTEDSEDWMEIIVQTFTSYNAIVARVMFPKTQLNSDCDMVTGLTKVFLSHYNELDKLIESKSISKIETASCMLNIVQIGEEMKRCGVIRNFWEGSLKGEAYIQVIKPYIRRGVQLKGTPLSAMKKCFRRQALEVMKNDVVSENNDTEDDGGYDTNRYRKYHSYRSAYDIEEALTSNIPIAGVFDSESRTFFVLIGWGREKFSQDLKLTNYSQVMSTTCFDVDIVHEGTVINHTKFGNEDSTVTSVLFLPIFQYDNRENTSTGNKYYAITEEHLELATCDFNFEFPKTHVTRKLVTESNQDEDDED